MHFYISAKLLHMILHGLLLSENSIDLAHSNYALGGVSAIFWEIKNQFLDSFAIYDKFDSPLTTIFDLGVVYFKSLVLVHVSLLIITMYFVCRDQVTWSFNKTKRKKISDPRTMIVTILIDTLCLWWLHWYMLDKIS